MPRSVGSRPAPPREQINARLDDETRDRLDTAAFIDGKTVPELLREIVHTHIDDVLSPVTPEALAARSDLQGEAPEEFTRAVQVVKKYHADR